MNHPIVLGITGASGAIYALRLLDVLRSAGCDVHLSISTSGREVILQELQREIDLQKFDLTAIELGNEFTNTKDLSQNRRGLAHFAESSEQNVPVPLSSDDFGIGPKTPSPCPLPKGGNQRGGQVHYFHHQNFLAPMASGSFLTAGMVICPCSGTTLSAVAAGAATNLIQRAAEVHLKERRKLVLVPRETPLSLAHIDNMRRVTEAGAVVLPASPGWYHGVRSTADLVDFVVARICDQLGIEHNLTHRWGTE